MPAPTKDRCRPKARPRRRSQTATSTPPRTSSRTTATQETARNDTDPTAWALAGSTLPVTDTGSTTTSASLKKVGTTFFTVVV
ncbi:hypothetical protein [Kineosporia sp. A_224]|uniref:hypothetical protein n=1 Tax=Kineosporia sp. A_224 TaxID=1962180 RepID=UPI00117A3AC8|nr:hypothetical protein [Kineosporia sp. A_224]